MPVNDLHPANLDPSSSDKYKGMRELNFGVGPYVIVCGVAGAVLGLILSMWATSEVGIIGATVVTFGILSGLFGMFF
jgi:hypothetical protein